ncbi:HNH endonuclease [uncultured Hydrogenophaga sp.]|jgi:putative restriction endonuclease|uniref:HNH endonuclease n=1 Tax=uncultured Hydrogenophaga sp. TaxID=199683 RepID=UPI0025894007|nr:HNH endonuclease [uncultured Hydrogenophaga sp.]
MPSYYWVNQGGTFEEERKAGLLWAPERTSTGSRLAHWDTMTELLPEDVVFNYANGAIRAYAIVNSAAVSMMRPYDVGSPYSSAQGGRVVMCSYRTLRSPIPLTAVTANEALRVELQSGRNPVLDRRGAVAQKYLCAISPIAGQLVASLGDISPPPTKSPTPALTPTEVSRLVDARLGQGKFRDELLIEFNGKCPVTGLAIPDLLRASHIKAWTQADNHERLDRNNGLLLAAGVDAAFDKGYIAFSDNGELIVSSRLPLFHRTALGIPTGTYTLQREFITPQRRQHLEFHRAKYGL